MEFIRTNFINKAVNKSNLVQQILWYLNRYILLTKFDRLNIIRPIMYRENVLFILIKKSEIFGYKQVNILDLDKAVE